ADLIFTPEVTRPVEDDEPELEEPDDDEPEELLAVEELPELDELFVPELLEPDDPVLKKSCHTQPVLPLTRT
ncbi:hypothetical protein, partial [Nesterenkonia haasae]|uniref:hypothetical protein n=1 Tax=Nesterenkonia haasae TaxID=2587813 RepID=UPI00192ECF2B